MENSSILAIHEDKARWDKIGQTLQSRGFRFFIAESPEEGLNKLQALNVQLVLLDDSMPENEFLDLIRHIKARYDLPLFVVSHRKNPPYVVTSIELGADDFLRKPVDVHELTARIKTHLKLLNNVRRKVFEESQPKDSRGVKFGNFELDFLRHELRRRGGKPIGLTSGELEVLVALVKSAGKVLTREHIVARTRGPDSDSFDRAVDVQISRIREKMNCKTDLIKTVRGVGYMLDVKPEPLQD